MAKNKKNLSWVALQNRKKNKAIIKEQLAMAPINISFMVEPIRQKLIRKLKTVQQPELLQTARLKDLHR